MKKSVKLMWSGIVLASTASPALAQEMSVGQPQAAGGSALDEIIVTATKRAERLQDVALAISAVSSEQLQKNTIANPGDLQIPGVQFIATSGRATALSVRGVSTGGNPGFDQSVPLFIDGVYFGRGGLARAGFLDVERIEVLKGPQPTYLGKNAIAGALSIVSRRPGLELNGNITAYNEFEANEQNVEGGITVPLGERFSTRIAGRYSRMDGWVKNDALDTDGPRTKTAALRVSAVWDPTEALSIYAKFDHSYQLRIGSNAEAYACGKLAPTNPSFIQPGDDCTLNGHTSAVYGAANFPRIAAIKAPNPDYGRFKLNGSVVEAVYDLSGNTLTATASYYKINQYDRLDADSTNVQTAVVETYDNSKQRSLEIKAASPTGEAFTWLVGAYGDIIDLAMRVPGGFWVGGDPRFGGVPFGSFSQQLSKQREKSWSAYGEFGYEIFDNLTVKAASRYSSVQKTLYFSNYTSSNAIYLAPGHFLEQPGTIFPGFAISDDRIFRDFQPAITFEYRPAKGALLFASYKEGFKSGGYDLDAFFTKLDGTTAFRPEKVKSLEAGAKIDFLDGRARFNLTAFRSSYDNLQVSVFNGVAGVETRNAATSRSQGIEVETQFAPVRGLVLSGSVNYLDAKYGHFPDTSCYSGQTVAEGCVSAVQDLSGRTRVYSPKLSGTFNADVTVPLDGFLGSETELNGGLNIFVTSRYATSASLGPRAFQEGFTTVDGRIGLNFASGQYGIGLIGRNLTNELIYDGRQSIPFTNNSIFSANLRRTRQLSLQLSAKF